MKKEHAQALYKMGGESKEIALQYFSENELSDTRPRSFTELKTISGHYISSTAVILPVSKCAPSENNKNTFPTEEYAEAALALAQLLQIKKRWFDGEIDYSSGNVLGISMVDGEVGVYGYNSTPYWTHFPTMEMAAEFIAEPEIRKLLEQVKPLL